MQKKKEVLPSEKKKKNLNLDWRTMIWILYAIDILDARRTADAKFQYLVKVEETWESEESLHCPELIEEFWKKKKIKKK